MSWQLGGVPDRTGREREGYAEPRGSVECSTSNTEKQQGQHLSSFWTIRITPSMSYPERRRVLTFQSRDLRKRNILIIKSPDPSNAIASRSGHKTLMPTPFRN